MSMSSNTQKRLKVELSCTQFYKKLEEEESENMDYLGRRRSSRIKEIKPKPVTEDVWVEVSERTPINSVKAESDYERLRLKNIQEKAALLESLGIDESKRILADTGNQHRPTKPRIPKPKEKLPLRSPSLRLRKRSPEHVSQNFVETKSGALVKIDPKMKSEENTENDRILGPMKMEKSYYSTRGNFSSFVENLKNAAQGMHEVSQAVNVRPADKSWFGSLYEMTITSDKVAKVVPARISSVAVHPCTSRLLTVAGDKYGHVGFWSVDAKDEVDGVHLFHPHTRNVNCIAFTPGHPEKMCTSSYDGTVRCTDLENEVFDEVLSPENPDDHWISFFDFVSPSTLCLSHGDGCLEIVDTRVKVGTRLQYKISLRRVKTVSVHPVQKHYVLTACNDGNVSVWDLRNMASKPKPCSELPHFRSVNSAFFSPVTGNSILTSSSDNCIRLYDVTNPAAKHSPKTEICHDNYVGRWLTNFRPVWVPGREDCFIVGCMKQPRRIELFLTTGAIQREFYGEELSSVCSINAFHPTQNIVVGGNSSGRLFVFR